MSQPMTDAVRSLVIKCPKCGASVGAVCRTEIAGLQRAAHRERIVKWRKERAR